MLIHRGRNKWGEEVRSRKSEVRRSKLSPVPYHLLLLFFLPLATIHPPLLYGQSTNAAITGQVTDPTKAVIPDVKITAINTGTNLRYEGATDKSGSYVIASLPPGNYRIEVEKLGFRTIIKPDIILHVQDTLEINFEMALGSASETVTVTGLPSLLQAQTSDRGVVITGRQVVDLPLRDRNFTGLATLQTGVTRAYSDVLTDGTAFNQGDRAAGKVPGGSDPEGSTEASRFSRSGGASISVSGLRPSNNNFTLDGVDNNEPEFQTIGVFPNPEAIGEFKIGTNGAKAEYGRGGAVINVIYKSGTNNLHGALYYFGQNDALNASHWVINKFNLPKSTVRINEFGGAVGGPVVLPGYNGKNRTFFFFDYLGQRNLFPSAFETAVPTAGSRVGDFSDFDAPVIDPLTCKTPGDTSSGGCQQFQGNIIPNLKSRSDFSPQGFALLNAYPLPTRANVRNPDDGNPNWVGVRRNQESINSYDIKIDQGIGTNNHLFGRFTHDNQQRLRANVFPGLPAAGFGAGQEIGNTRQDVIRETHIFTPTVLNEARFGWTQVDIGILNCGVQGACGVPPDWCTKMGIPNCNKGTPSTTGGLLTGAFGSGFLQFIGDGGLFRVRSNNFYVADDLTIVHGKHTIKTGVSARPTKLSIIDGGRLGFLKGHIQYCGEPFCTGSTGNAQADYLLQRPAIFAQSATIEGGDNPLQLKKTEWGMYVQDDWKATPDLTLNVGLRYEIFPEFHEESARLANYDIAASFIVRAKGSGDSLINTDNNNLGPRVGFAYNFGPQKEFVLRGGYGLFYAQDGVDFPPLGRNPPGVSSVVFSAFSGNQGNFNLTTGPPVAPVVNPPVITPTSSLFTRPRDPSVASVHEWHLGVQWQFAKDYLLDIGYVASRSRHLLSVRNLGASGNGLGLALTPTGDHLDSVILYENRASANFDSLQVSLRKALSHGLEFLTSYTWGHNIDDSTGVFNAIGGLQGGTSGGPTDPFDFGLDRGNSSLDHRHVLVVSAIWELPFGRGKLVGGNVGGRLDKLIGGWQVNVIQTAQSGQHFDVFANSPSGGGAARADIVGLPFSGNEDTFLNIKSFRAPSTFVTNLAGNRIFVGDLARNALTGPGLFNTDLSVFKNISITERVKAQARIEFFNAWNEVNRVVPNNNISQGGFGQFNNAFPPRTIQYAMKIIF